MNVWECGHPGCQYSVTGCGGAIGLRAIGWYVQFGGTRFGPLILCPRHRADQIPCAEGASDACSLCAGETAAKAVQDQLYTPEDQVVLEALKSL